MRILVAPDAFAGTLSAPGAAAAIAAGWQRQAPADELVMRPMSDGGEGFLDVLHDSLGGALLPVTVRGPYGDPTPATVLLSDDGRTAYLESAQACGRRLTQGEPAERATSYGVGELILAAVEAGATRLVVGLGDTGGLDGGAGLLAALGATADVPLDGGGTPLAGLTGIDAGVARRRLDGLDLIAATDVDSPLTGLFGAAKTFGAQLGLDEEQLPGLDAALGTYAAALDRRRATEPGAGAAGGIGYALLVLGATRRPGAGLVAEAVDLAAEAARADLVLTGEGAFDFSSRGGKVPAEVATVAAEAIRPCVVLAGQVLVGTREMRTLGVEAAYSMVELVGEERARGEAATALSELATRVARTWSR